MMLAIFSYAYLLSMNLLQWSVGSNFLLIKKVALFIFLLSSFESVKNIYIFWIAVRYVIFKYFLPVCGFGVTCVISTWDPLARISHVVPCNPQGAKKCSSTQWLERQSWRCLVKAGMTIPHTALTVSESA